MRQFIHVFCLLLISCSSQKRLARLVKNHPELKTNQTVRLDTVLINPGEDLDTTVFTPDSSISPITWVFPLKRGSVKLTRINDSTTQLQVSVPADTAKISVVGEVPLIQVNPSISTAWDDFTDWIQNKILLLLLIVVLFLALRRPTSGNNS